MTQDCARSIPSLAFFHWSDEMSVGVRELDSQHRRLISMTNTLTLAMLTGKRSRCPQFAMDAMLDYAALHFAAEEAYMREFGFDGYDSHRREHALFTEKARELGSRARDGEGAPAFEIVDFLSSWLRSHIRRVDREYERLFRSRGLR